MTISRRDTLRVAAALGASRALAPFAVGPEDAAAMLAAPAGNDQFPYLAHELTWGRFGDEVDPVSFAVEIESTDFGFFSGSANGAAEEWAAYKQALDRVVALDPDLLDHHRNGWQGRACDHPMVLLDELVVAMGNTMYRAGIVAGAAYEHLRLAKAAPRSLCACNGHGCESCGGTGTVATTRPTLGFWPAGQRSPSERMQDRLARMSEAERTELYAFMEKDENVRRMMTYALGATDAQLRELLEIMETEIGDRRGGNA